MKGVCLKTGTTKPKKPNSGERKIARIRLSNGSVVTGYIPGEGMSLDSPQAKMIGMGIGMGKKKRDGHGRASIYDVAPDS